MIISRVFINGVVVCLNPNNPRVSPSFFVFIFFFVFFFFETQCPSSLPPLFLVTYVSVFVRSFDQQKKKVLRTPSTIVGIYHYYPFFSFNFCDIFFLFSLTPYGERVISPFNGFFFYPLCGEKGKRSACVLSIYLVSFFCPPLFIGFVEHTFAYLLLPVLSSSFFQERAVLCAMFHTIVQRTL